MILNQIKYLLKSHTGMHMATVGDSILNVAIQTRLRELDIDDTASYLALLQRSHDELTELTEEVVIPETWFFRDRHPFDTLGMLTEKALLENSSPGWRILSVPSSTGEEPYSIAMTLLMAGMKPDQFCIEAMDISQRALARAKNGHYGQHSFRGVQDSRVRERFFDASENDYIIKPEIREMVNFKHANLLDKRFSDQPGYDIIFCRNLLIYFDDEGKEAAYKTLHHLLNPNGILFIGHSESGAIPNSFTHTRHTGAFAYRKNTGQPETDVDKLLGLVKKHSVIQEIPASITENSQPVTNKADTLTKAEIILKTNSDSDLEQARKYANAGDFFNAEIICREYLDNNVHDASAHYLLGLIWDKDQPDKAEKSYRKALYLDPHYSDALTQLALLLERQGKPQQAQQLRQRAIKQQEQSA